MANDLVSRRAVIEALMQTDALMGAPWVDGNGDPIDDMDERKEIIEDWISCVSSEPEIIRCKDCIYVSPNKVYGCVFEPFDTLEDGERMYSDDFCSRAERRTDE